MIDVLRIDHVAIAVKDYKKAFEFFTKLFGAIPGSSAQVPGTDYFWQNMSLGDLSRIELLTPIKEGSFLDNFLKNRSGGVHHITMQTSDINAVEEALKSADIPYFGRFDYPVGYWKELFIHPKDAFGVLIQIAEFEADEWLTDKVRIAGGRKFTVRRTAEGCELSLMHPGGGKVDIRLSKEEMSKLRDSLS